MVRFCTLAVLLIGCTDESDHKKKAQGPEGLPEVWGLSPVTDEDPADDVVEVHLSASKGKNKYIDGGRASVWNYNDEIPGPLIQARVGDTLRVVFTNDLPESTTIHWHGLRIPSAMDGVPAVQAPIEPGETFTYEFVLPDSGSYWYHPHVRSNEQVERGLYGALVVHEEAPPAFDRDRYFVLDDVLLDDDGEIAYPGSLSGMDGMHGRHGNVLLANGSAEVLEDTMAHGTRERWRIVNTANARTMFVKVTGADTRVVAVDGTLLPEPYRLRQNHVLPVGRRLDLEVVPTDKATKAKLVIQVPDSATTFVDYPVFRADLIGQDASPGFLPWDVPALPELATPTQDIAIDLNASTDNGLQWTINGAVYGEGSAIPVRGHEPTVIEINELSGFEHPFHLHGQFFQVVDRSSGELIPGMLDTLLIEPLETVHVQTDFDNPGIWMAHCHILEHAELGMMTEVHVSE